MTFNVYMNDRFGLDLLGKKYGSDTKLKKRLKSKELRIKRKKKLSFEF